MRRALPLLLLAAVLLAIAWLLLPHASPDTPLVNVGLIASWVGGFGSGFCGAARLFGA